jgi:hypothetical protein|tara:strand:- start:329 stop:469 length:141 start_codon:yes stop_codon:yes gene_type:complete
MKRSDGDEGIELVAIGPFQLITILAVMPVCLADACEKRYYCTSVAQ